MKLTIKGLKKLKGKRKITMASCFGYYEAKAMETAGIDALGTGGGLFNKLVRGDETEDQYKMESHFMSIKGVRKGAPNTLVFTDMPFGYQFLGINDTLKTQFINVGSMQYY